MSIPPNVDISVYVTNLRREHQNLWREEVVYGMLKFDVVVVVCLAHFFECKVELLILRRREKEKRKEKEKEKKRKGES